jgi:hypothetical protein
MRFGAQPRKGTADGAAASPTDRIDIAAFPRTMDLEISLVEKVAPVGEEAQTRSAKLAAYQ